MMKSPKNLLKKLYGGVSLTNEEYNLLIETYSNFMVGDTVIYNGGVKYIKYDKKFVRKNLGGVEPYVEKLTLKEKYVVSGITVSPSINQNGTIDFDNVSVGLYLEGFKKVYLQKHFLKEGNFQKIKVNTVEGLTQLMNECIEVEDYLKAAYYRDEIKKIS